MSECACPPSLFEGNSRFSVLPCEYHGVARATHQYLRWRGAPAAAMWRTTATQWVSQRSNCQQVETPVGHVSLLPLPVSVPNYSPPSGSPPLPFSPASFSLKKVVMKRALRDPHHKNRVFRNKVDKFRENRLLCHEFTLQSKMVMFWFPMQHKYPDEQFT